MDGLNSTPMHTIIQVRIGGYCRVDIYTVSIGLVYTISN